MWLFKFRMFGYRMSLWIAHRLGRTIYLMKRGWLPPVFWLLATTFFIWLIDLIRHNDFIQRITHVTVASTDSWFQFEAILAVYVILWLLWWAWQGHKRVVIDTFMDYTGTTPLSDSQGLATLLVVKLAQLHELYRVVDEQRAISTAATANQPIDATIKVDDVSDFLMGAVSTQSKLNLGPLEIPIGTLLGLLGRFVQGPRIIGSLHKDNDNLIMTAQRVGSIPTCSWRVDSVDSISVDGAKKSIDDMVGELACRIFTDLSLSGTVRWKAAKSFSEGLRHYRDCLRSSKDRLLKLRQAERKFIETLEEDKDFVLAHYNLGVVYMELGQGDGVMETGQLGAAEEAFLEAISHNPGSWIPYYALAVCRYQREQYDSAYRICLRIGESEITQKPGKTNIAKIYHMMGLAQMKGLAQSGSHNHQSLSTVSMDVFKSAIVNYKKALRQARGALCKAERWQLGVTGTESLLIPQLEATLGVCLQDLAISYIHYAERLQKKTPQKADRYDTYYQRAHELLRLATFKISANSENYSALFNTYSDNYVHVAKMYCDRENYPRAIKEYRAALRIDPENAKFWAYFAFMYASLYEQQKNVSPKEAEESKNLALEACDNAKNYTFELSDETNGLMATMVETYKKLDEPELHQQTVSVAAFLQRVLSFQTRGMPPVEVVDGLVGEIGLIAQNDSETLAWIYAQVSLVISKMYLHSKQADMVENFVRGAIGCLEITHPHVIRERELRVILVYALLQQEKYEEGLQEAEHALVLDPLCYLERQALGDVYFKLNAFENAITAWQEALLRKNTFVPKLKVRELPKIEMPILDFKLGMTYLFKQDDVDINFKIGISYVELGRHYHDLRQKRNAYQLALTYLERAEQLYESNYERQQQKHALYYFLGVLHFEQDDYQRAISYLRIAKTLHFARLTSLFYLGYAYLKNKEYDSCIKQFCTLREEALQLEHKGMPPDEIVESETVGFMSLGELLAMTYWGMAYAYAERSANLVEAQKLVQAGQEYMQRLAKETKVHWPAHCLDCDGWISFKLGKVDEAIKVLKRAITLSDHPQVYVHLALAYEWKLQEAKDEVLLQDLRYCYQYVREIDVKNEYKQEMEVVSQRLQKT